MLDFKVFITNLAKYNEGYLVGKWVNLPTYGELDEIVEEILGDDEEFFITDYENNIGYEVGEYENIYKLDDLLERVEQLEEGEFKTLLAAIEWEGSGFIEDILDNLDEYTLWEDIENDWDLGYYWIHESGCYDIPEYLEGYIDYEKLGRDWGMDGYFSEYGYIERC